MRRGPSFASMPPVSMDVESFIERVEDAVEDLEPGTITVGTRFKELPEWDSLAVLTVIAMLESEYGVRLNGRDLKAAERVGELFEGVRERARTADR